MLRPRSLSQGGVVEATVINYAAASTHVVISAWALVVTLLLTGKSTALLKIQLPERLD